MMACVKKPLLCICLPCVNKLPFLCESRVSELFIQVGLNNNATRIAAYVSLNEAEIKDRQLLEWIPLGSNSVVPMPSLVWHY